MELLGHKALIEKYLKERPNNLSSHSFVNIFLWQQHFDFSFEIVDQHLCIFAANELGTFQYLPPLGKNTDKSTVNKCFEIMEKRNKAKGVARIENAEVYHVSMCTGNGYVSHQKDYEHCYYKRDLVALKGNDYKSKRSSYNHFVKNNKCRYVRFEKDMMEESLALFKVWAKQRAMVNTDAVYRQMLDENYGVHRLAMEFCDELGLIGSVVLVDDRIKAYTFGYPINEKVFCVLLEIADTGCEGLPVFVFREFCADKALRQFDFINVMDGFGIKNVEWTKMSFRPAVLLSSYVISKRK